MPRTSFYDTKYEIKGMKEAQKTFQLKALEYHVSLIWDMIQKKLPATKFYLIKEL